MNKNLSKTKILRVIAFIVMVAIFFPFATVSCNNGLAKEKGSITFSTFDIAKGISVDDSMLSKDDQKKSDPSAIVLIIIIIGFALSTFLLKLKARKIGIIISSSIGFILVLIMRAVIIDNVKSQSLSTMTVDFKIGFYIMVLGFISAIVIEFVPMNDNENVLPNNVNTNLFCTNCGSKNIPGNKFCTKCGSPISP